jgi:hypothetical protein
VASSPDTGAHSADEGRHADEGSSANESHHTDDLSSSADRGRHDQSRSSHDGAPPVAPRQSCAFCGGADVVWVHPLATDRVQFRRFGKDDTLPSFWALCESCEQLYQNGEDDQLIALMKLAGGWIWQGTDVEDVLRKPVDVFREADLGRRPMGKA